LVIHLTVIASIHQDDPEKSGDDMQRNIVKPMSKTTVIASEHQLTLKKIAMTWQRMGLLQRRIIASPAGHSEFASSIARSICMCDLHAGDAIMRLYVKKTALVINILQTRHYKARSNL
jgi:hypothetical protein